MLEPGEPAVHVRGRAFDLITDGVDVSDGAGRYNAWSSSINGQGAFAVAPPAQSGNVPVSINPTEWALTPAKGLMVVSQDNQSGKDEAALLELKLN